MEIVLNELLSCW